MCFTNETVFTLTFSNFAFSKMKAINYHIKAVLEVILQLSKGRFLFYFVPGLIVTGLYYYTTGWFESTENSVTFLSSIPLIGSYLDSALSGTFHVLKYIIDQFYVFLILTVLSPFNTHLSEKLDSQLTGQSFTSGLIRILNDLIRMIFIVIIALILEFFFLGIWWAISGIFGIPDSIYVIGSFLMASFFFGFSFYDHSLERYEKGVMGSLGFAFKNMFIVTLTGAIFNLIYQLPFIGITLSPVLTTMVATVVFVQFIGKYKTNKTSETNE